MSRWVTTKDASARRECPDGVDDPLIGIGVPQYGLSEPVEREPSAMSITMIGLDTAKSVFQVTL